MKPAYLLYSLLIPVFLMNCQSSGSETGDEVKVFCAASLTNILTELKDTFVLHNPVSIKLNFASSGTLARQIEHGNLPDIFIPANKQWADYADSLNLFGIQKPLYRNKLVVIAPLSSPLDSIDFNTPIDKLFQGYISMGDPAHVPAGIYAVQALSALGWYDDLEKRILPARDVRSALMVVELGECELGIVYYSDAIQSAKVKILGTFPEQTHQPVILYALLAKNAGKSSTEFFDLLSAKATIPVWIKYGFTPVDTCINHEPF